MTAWKYGRCLGDALLHGPLLGSSVISLGLWAVLLAQPAQGHGTRVTHQIVPSVEIQAQFDSGEPMTEAQVAVFAPDHPETPWQTGLTDEAGNFRFVPDPALAGNWEVQVRQAGHGNTTTIAVGDAGIEAGEADGTVAAASSIALNPNAFSLGQRLLMTGLGLWGLLGTGLYFSRRSAARSPSLSEGSGSGSAVSESPVSEPSIS